MTKKFLGFFPKDAPDAVIAAYVREAARLTTEWEGDDQGLRRELALVWEGYFAEREDGRESSTATPASGQAAAQPGPWPSGKQQGREKSAIYNNLIIHPIRSHR